jgi:YfiH family protein
MTIAIEQADSLQSIPGVVHGFFERHGGVSQGYFASLNCSLMLEGETKSSVLENRRRAMAYLHLENHRLMVPHLAHGINALIVSDKTDIERLATMPADAVITTRTDIALGITYADCLPILVASRDGSVIAAIHGGWRGIKDQVIASTLQWIEKLHGPMDLVSAIGPAISQSGFLVKDEVFDFFSTHWPDFVIGEGSGRIDLTGIATAQLRKAGVSVCEKVGGYTDQNPDKYFSHRRDKGLCGRHLALIALAR